MPNVQHGASHMAFLNLLSLTLPLSTPSQILSPDLSEYLPFPEQVKPTTLLCLSERLSYSISFLQLSVGPSPSSFLESLRLAKYPGLSQHFYLHLPSFSLDYDHDGRCIFLQESSPSSGRSSLTFPGRTRSSLP